MDEAVRSSSVLEIREAMGRIIKPPQVEPAEIAVLRRPPGSSIGKRWFVVHTRAHMEARADLHLRAQNFTTFLPRVERTVRHARKMRRVLAAAFPGYLFVQMSLASDRWRSVNGTQGVSGLLMAHDLPAPVPSGAIEALMDYVDERGIARFERDLEPGQTIRIKDGPFARTVGLLMRLDSHGRVRVLLDIMGGKVEATLEKSALEAA